MNFLSPANKAHTLENLVRFGMMQTIAAVAQVLPGILPGQMPINHLSIPIYEGGWDEALAQMCAICRGIPLIVMPRGEIEIATGKVSDRIGRAHPAHGLHGLRLRKQGTGAFQAGLVFHVPHREAVISPLEGKMKQLPVPPWEANEGLIALFEFSELLTIGIHSTSILEGRFPFASTGGCDSS